MKAPVRVLRVVHEAPDVPRQPPSDRLRSAFLANMSHELRTPLTSVLGFAKLLKAGRAGDLNELQVHYVERVLEGGQHLLHLVSDLLDLARIESGRLEFRPEQTDLSALVEDTVAAVRPLADAKALDLLHRSTADQEAFLDPVRFRQVLYNYLSNAIKFTPQGGRVEVLVQTLKPVQDRTVVLRAKDRGAAQSMGDASPVDRVRVEVRDTGVGIPADQVPRLFTEFTQLENAMDGSLEAERGAGLGLAITKRLVEAMGGRVGVESRVGQGSVFWAELPRFAPSGPLKPPAAPAPESIQDPSGSATSDRKGNGGRPAGALCRP